MVMMAVSCAKSAPVSWSTIGSQPGWLIVREKLWICPIVPPPSMLTVNTSLRMACGSCEREALNTASLPSMW